jgi:Tfp pilus assembly protein PilF
MRRVGDGSPKWKDLEDDARFHLSSALGVDGNSVEAYTLYGLVYMEGYKKNKNRLDLAKVLLDEAKERNEKSPDLQNAYGLYFLRRNALSEALKHFKQAVEAKPSFAEARMNVGLITLRFRDYEAAKEQFSKVLDQQPKNYDAVVGLGAALRGLKDFPGAEREYKRAMDMQRGRGEAFYNLGVLYKDFLATKEEPQKSIGTYRTAKGFFTDYLSTSGIEPDDAKEAKEQIALIDKTILQTEKFLKALASQPPPPPPAPAPAPPAGGAPPGGAPPVKK